MVREEKGGPGVAGSGAIIWWQIGRLEIRAWREGQGGREVLDKCLRAKHRHTHQ